MAPNDSLQPQAIALIFLFPSLASMAVLLRAYGRTMTRTFAIDDWVICAALLLYWAETATSYYVIKFKYIGYHIWNIPEDAPRALGAKFGYITELLYNPILALVKASILLFLLRLTGQKIGVRRAIWVIFAVNAVAMVATFLLTTLHCLPIAANWHPNKYPRARCINFANFVTGTACVSIFTDVLVLLLPTWIVYNLQIPRRQKIMLVGILSFGVITVVSGIVRVILLDEFDRNPPRDATYSVIFCLSTIEIGLAFIAACAPALKPLVVRALPAVFASSRKQRYGTDGEPGVKRSRPDYELGERVRGPQHGRSAIKVQSGAASPDTGLAKTGIVMTTDLDVQWDDDAQGLVQGQQYYHGSTESLMR